MLITEKTKTRMPCTFMIWRWWSDFWIQASAWILANAWQVSYVNNTVSTHNEQSPSDESDACNWYDKRNRNHTTAWELSATATAVGWLDAVMRWLPHNCVHHGWPRGHFWLSNVKSHRSSLKLFKSHYDNQRTYCTILQKLRFAFLTSYRICREWKSCR